MRSTRRRLLILALLIAIAACAGEGGPPDPDQPIEGIGGVVDWDDPSKVVQLEGGWTIRACEGEGPFLCVERNGAPVGVVEAITFPLASFDDLDPAADPLVNLELLAAGFAEAIGSDRLVGCGPDYGFSPLPVEEFVLGGTPGISYGFVGTMPDGTPSELNLQYATIVGDQILSIAAIAYDEGGCPGRDDLSGFDSAALAEFRPHLEAVLHQSPIPDL